MITKHEADFKEFGQVAFEMRAVKYARGTNQEKIYHLNEQQATLLIAFLKNTEPVIAFKTELVRQFYAMRSELQRREMLRSEMKPIRRALTDVIQDKPDAGKWDYKLFTDLAYKTILGRNAAQIRKDRGAPVKAKAIDYMTSSEIAAIAKLQSQIAVLLEMGMCYQQIKMMLLNRQVVGNIA
jgi:phage regulator Rha-like protein